MYTTDGKSFSDLQSIPLRPADRAGSRWSGIEHAKLIGMLIEKLEEKGWKIRDGTYTTSNDGADLAGVIPLEGYSGPLTEKGRDLAIGILNSNNMHGPMKLLLCVLLNESVIVLGSVVIAVKRTVFLDLDERLDESLRIFRVKAKCIPKIEERLQRKVLDDNESNRLLMEAGRLEIMPFSRVGLIDAKYREGEERTAWSLLCSFCQVVKMNPPLRQLDQSERFLKLILPS